MSIDQIDQTILRAAHLLEELNEIEPDQMKDWVHGMKPTNKAQAVANLLGDTILGLMMQKAGADG